MVDVEASALTNLARGTGLRKSLRKQGDSTPLHTRRGRCGAAGGRPQGVHRRAGTLRHDGRAHVDQSTTACTNCPQRSTLSPRPVLPNPGISAWTALEHGGRSPSGDSVLVLGATGVTGATAVQLAKSAFGAGWGWWWVGRDVEGTGLAAHRRRRRVNHPRRTRSTSAIRSPSCTPLRPFDAVLDYLWGDPAQQTTELRSPKATRPLTTTRTRFVQIGSMAGPTMNLAAGVLRGSGNRQ